MNETVNSTSVRHGKDLSLDSPLLNLILAASLLSKISQTTAKTGERPSLARGPPLPYRFPENHYDSLPYFSRDGQHFYKLQASLNTHETSFPIRQLHVYQDGGQDSLQPTTEIPKSTYVVPLVDPDNPNTTNFNNQDDPQNITKENLKLSDELPENSSGSQLTKELKDFLTVFFSKNLPQIQNYKTEKQETGKLEIGKPEVLQNLPVNKISTDKFVENISESLVDEMAHDLPDNASETEVKHMSESVIQNLPTNILETIPPKMLEEISDKISEQISEKLSEKFSKDVSIHMLEQLAALIPERHNTTENLVIDSVTENPDDNKIPEAEENFPVYSEEKHLEDIENYEHEHDGTGTSGLMFGSQSAASSIELHASETQKSERNNRNPQKKTKSSESEDEYVFRGNEEDEDDDDDEDDTFRETERESEFEDGRPSYKVSPKFAQKLRSTTENPRKTIRNKSSPQQTGSRINSKRPTPNKRKTTPISLIYDDEVEDETTKRKPVRKTNPVLAYDPDEKPFRQVQSLSKNRLKPSTKKRTTTPVYSDYYNDPVDNGSDEAYDPAEQDYDDLTTPRPRRTTRRSVVRQQDTETTTLLTTNTDDGDTDETGTTMSTTTPMPTSNATSGEYPYYGGNNYDNISITYGPPVHHYPGYGPSHGNEYVSFTYAPPPSSSGGGSGFSNFGTEGGTDPGVAAAGLNPTIDNWYNQYAKVSMYKRLQDLLTPNNFYSQYDTNYPSA